MNNVKSELFASVRRALAHCATPAGVAFSGGLDSSVLLDVVARTVEPSKTRAIHVCHNLRPEHELKAELELVRRACAELGVPLSVVSIPRGAIEAYAREKKCGIEAAARRFRYHAFARVAQQHGLSAILVAHHFDDQLETILMRLVHGGRVSALAGMRPMRTLVRDPYIAIIRPFLQIPKKELVLYAESAHLMWSEDSSNDESVYLRNRVRKSLMPLLDTQFGQWRAAFARYQTQIEDLSEAVRIRSREKLSEIERSVGEKPALELGPLRTEPRSVRMEILRQFVESLSAARRMRARGLRYLQAGIIQGRTTIEASGNAFALEQDLLVFLGPSPFSSSPERRALAALEATRHENSFYLKVASFGEFSSGPFNVRVARISIGGSSGGTPAGRSAREYAIPIKLPFVIRSVRAGDSIDTVNGRRDIDSMLKRAGLTSSLRVAVPIVEDAVGVAAMLPSALCCEGKARDAFREASLGEEGQIVYIFLSMKGDQSINV